MYFRKNKINDCWFYFPHNIDLLCLAILFAFCYRFYVSLSIIISIIDNIPNLLGLEPHIFLCKKYCSIVEF